MTKIRFAIIIKIQKGDVKMTYEQFAARMDELELYDWYAEMADSYSDTLREKARHAEERRALIAEVGEEWFERWKAEKKGK